MRLPLSNGRLLAALLALSGCATAQSGDVQVNYASDAQQNYELGQKELKDHNFLEATKYFEYVRAKYPYSSFAALADLALADSEFEQEKYVEAVDRYRNFIKLHPANPKVDYAAYRIGLAYYDEIPSDLFFLPPSAEKDQTDVKSALTTFTEFVASYPNSEFKKDAEEKIADLRHRLAKHEMAVADYYYDHQHLPAAAGRYETVLRNFPGAGFDTEAQIRLGRIYTQLGQPEKAKPFLEQLLKDHPDDKRAGEARRLLGQG